MIINYYEGKKLQHIEIHTACPGCGRLDKLAMHEMVKSYMHNRKVYYLACACGWQGPEAEKPMMAGVKWEARALIQQLAVSN